MTMNSNKTFGEIMGPMLLDLENAIHAYDAEVKTKPNYPSDALRSAAVIFISVLMDKMYDLMEAEEMPHEDRLNMAFKCGTEIHNIIKVYANIDLHE